MTAISLELTLPSQLTEVQRLQSITKPFPVDRLR
jgi:hypothetical protein